jgi:hypothetical protein
LPPKWEMQNMTLLTDPFPFPEQEKQSMETERR